MYEGRLRNDEKRRAGSPEFQGFLDTSIFMNYSVLKALDVMLKMKEKYVEQFPKLAFDVSTKEECLFGTYHDKMDKIYLGRLNLLNLSEELIKEALGMK